MPGRQTRRLRKWAALPCVVFLLLSQRSPLERTATSAMEAASSFAELTPGQSIHENCSSSQSQTFAIFMEPEQFLRFSIIKGDLALSVEAYSPSGTRVLEYVSHTYETIEGSLLSETSGSYRIVVRSLETSASPRSYELRLQAARRLTKDSRRDHEARQLIAGATVLRAQWTKTSLHQAIEKYDNAAAIWKEEGNYSDAAKALLEAGEVCFLLSEYSNAFKRYQSASQLAAASDDLTESRALSQIGLVSSYLGNNDEAELYLTNALSFLGSADEGHEGPLLRQALAKATSNLGEVTYSKGNLVRSLTQFARAQKIFAEIGDRNGQANMHLFAGYATGSLGIPEKPISEINAALKLFREVNNRAGEGRALTVLGLVSSLKRNEDDAINLHRSALEIFQKIGDRHSEAIALTGLGQSYEDMSEYSISLDYYQEALGLFQRVGALDLASVAMCKVGAVYRLGANLDQALFHYQRCLDMSRAAKKSRTEAIALEEVATIYAAQGHLEQTHKQYLKLERFYERLGDTRGQVSALNSSGDSFLLLGQRQQAVDAYTRALPLSEKAGDSGAIASTLYNLARVDRDLGSFETALAYIDRSLTIVEDIRKNFGSPDFRASYFSSIRKYYDLRIDILMQLDRAHPNQGYALKAFLTSENARARSLLDLLSETHADLRGSVPPELLTRVRELQGLLRGQAQYLIELSVSGRDYREMAEVNAEMDRLRSEYLELQSRLSAQSHQRLAFVEPSSLNLQQIQEQLHDRETMLLEFALGEVRSYLWVVTHDSFKGYELPPGKILQDRSSEVYKLLTARQDLEKLKGDDYTAKVEAADNLYLEKAGQLSQMLLGQITEQLSQSKRLLIVPEGPLQYLSFEALPSPGDRRSLAATDPVSFLISTHEIVHLPSISSLIAIRNTSRRISSADNIVAVFADPVFSIDDERVNQQATVSKSITGTDSKSIVPDSTLPLNEAGDSRGLVRLSYTSNEASAILAVTPNGTSSLAEGFDADRERAMSSQIGQFQIVHFATHSFLNSEHPELSGLVLTMVDPNGAKKNGLMLLPDIYSLDLSAEVTVLSACETALGKDLSGEGLVGLTHGFLSAGSKSIVASLWKVDDRATAMLMSDFYQSMLQNGMPPAAALRAAKLNVMKQQRWQAPYYWAGFVFQGEYENHIAVKKTSSRRLVAIFVTTFFVIVVGLILVRRRRRFLPESN